MKQKMLFTAAALVLLFLSASPSRAGEKLPVTKSLGNKLETI